MADENLHFQRHTNFLIKLQCSVFSSATLFLFRRQCAEFFFFKKIRQMKADQNIKYYIIETSGLLQVRVKVWMLLQKQFHPASCRFTWDFWYEDFRIALHDLYYCVDIQDFPREQGPSTILTNGIHKCLFNSTVKSL